MVGFRVSLEDITFLFALLSDRRRNLYHRASQRIGKPGATRSKWSLAARINTMVKFITNPEDLTYAILRACSRSACSMDDIYVAIILAEWRIERDHVFRAYKKLLRKRALTPSGVFFRQDVVGTLSPRLKCRTTEYGMKSLV